MEKVISLSRFIHQRFLWLLLSCYLLAGVWPAIGLWLRNISVGRIDAFQQQTIISLPMVMLAMLLLNAGVGVELSGLKGAVSNLKFIGCGLTANLLVPLVFIFLVSCGMAWWHNPDE